MTSLYDTFAAKTVPFGFIGEREDNSSQTREVLFYRQRCITFFVAAIIVIDSSATWHLHSEEKNQKIVPLNYRSLVAGKFPSQEKIACLQNVANGNNSRT